LSNSAHLGEPQNTYAISHYNGCLFLSGKKHDFATKPDWNGPGDVIGCGLQLNASNKLAIFFTFNGILLGQFYCCWAVLCIMDREGLLSYPTFTDPTFASWLSLGNKSHQDLHGKIL
jgi:hypothetical protein